MSRKREKKHIFDYLFTHIAMFLFLLHISYFFYTHSYTPKDEKQKWLQYLLLSTENSKSCESQSLKFLLCLNSLFHVLRRIKTKKRKRLVPECIGKR